VNSDELIDRFLESPGAKSLKEKKLLQAICSAAAGDSSAFYDLTFHAAFAKRMFDIIRREGPQTMGFERMQQTFTASVEKIREILIRFEVEDRMKTTELTAITPEAKARLSRIIEDLALLKNWLTSQDDK
jgi:hypothetical protein